MSDFGLPREVIRGQDVTGTGTIYTVTAGQRLRLETLAFTLTTSSTNVTRFAVVQAYAQSGPTIWTVQDLTDVSKSWTVYYTFGIGLEAFCGVTANGAYVRAELPDTVLEPGSVLALFSQNAAGAVVGGDVFTDVMLVGVSETAGDAPDVIPLLTPLALSDQEAVV